MGRIIRQAKLPNGVLLKTGDRCLFLGTGVEFICKYRGVYIFVNDDNDIFCCDAPKFKKYVRAFKPAPSDIAGTLFDDSDIELQIRPVL